MPWYGILLIGIAIGFAGGWAFYKHRLYLKDEALKDLQKLRQNITPR